VKKLILFGFGLLILFCNCRGKKAIADNAQQSVKTLIVDQKFSSRDHNTAVSIIHGEMTEQNILKIVFSYSGGCLEHSFDLYTHGAMVKTLPPKFNLFLVNHQREDACRQMIEDSLFFDISLLPLNQYEQAIGIINNKFELRIK
jgi:hypothetical protein